MLKEIFIALIKKYRNDNSMAEQWWIEIETAYSSKKRYYHNLTHLQSLLQQLTKVKAAINNWDALLFALYYHDIVYNTLKTDNEEKSALLAAKRMREINVPPLVIELTRQLILATKSHTAVAGSDVHYFTDADLCILGSTANEYEAYCKNIRKEYAVYPDIIYKPGRKKVLQHFLQMERIYKTEACFIKYEEQARQNLRNELALY